jgi:hypothetical protein
METAEAEAVHRLDWEIGWQELRAEPVRPARRRLSPLLVVAAALMLGAVVAKAIGWRAHAHPRG